MSIPIATERRVLTTHEYETVQRSHYPDISGVRKPELIDIARRLREFRDKARDVARGRQRERRGKAELRGATPARDETGLTVKKQIFASALRRVNKEIARHDADARRPEQGEIARQALEMKRANRARHHPNAGRTAHHGMRKVESEAVTTGVDPRKVGSISQQNKNFQGASDR
ncbi:hypothetical protein [Roseomonas sp. KE0001]|uniref:hypothetical protein n=1 Tax=Roseomonas sp. KE0001 TaxID=2479201 RepID=UPI0018E02A35|nr:hypothetical protein [Roseomonas sp. KE0001]MBI0435338.1 hypothetical protein [Roseomonas sp. KE0001]